jgi:hypothetical protein
VLPVLEISTAWRSGTLATRVADLAKLTRETVAMATVTAKPIATGPPDG